MGELNEKNNLTFITRNRINHNGNLVYFLN